ncbi:hypothetical protein J2Z32_002587 [Paenibacillus turicensis]|uniref:Winged helix DNA-binding domain-containing protein n=1 Tax=Paenibacillus turicensis TaxID=160487 RepID=A0ABS4FU12_9BACL|nr:crosslink repair DNA glycosylase YcaQ family protein [Paenibacillus turicensis]MBP1905939.1 hypothetical protein [Paenibacillus turicensis]
MNWTIDQVIRLRMARQGLLHPLTEVTNEEAYLSMFKSLQPVAPVFFGRPGEPPSLVHRTVFNDSNIAFYLREKHVIVKSRFQDGRVAYVTEDDLQLYATAFRKVPAQMSQVHEQVYKAVKQSGGLTKDQLKEILPYTAKEIGAALQTLQQAFLLVEEQVDSEWETGWLDFTEQWFEIPTDEISRLKAIEEVLLRFVEVMVFTDMEQFKSWSGFTAKTIKIVVDSALQTGKLMATEVEGIGEGWMCATDFERSSKDIAQSPLHSVIMLDKSDFLVRAHLSQLKKRYSGKEVLQYLLIDGQFQGAALGHWRIGPHDVEDIIVDLPLEEAASRKNEIINAVTYGYPPEFSKIKAYNGVVI